MHMLLLWIADCPVLIAQAKTEFIDYVDKHVWETELHDVVLTYQRANFEEVKSKIDESLDPGKPEYDPNHSTAEILASIHLTEEEYYNALSVSPDSDFRLYLKCFPDTCFINNYFVPGITAFNANIDIQPVFNYVKCVAYMCSHFWKDETECSLSLQTAASEARNNNSGLRETLQKVGAAFLNKREVSAQECVYIDVCQNFGSEKVFQEHCF